ncbi:MAG: DUF4190 domain-containing protein [Myxococcales bacterium]|nr:DUF4190 domain-containing protein [Polyangiaceae bacterium]MDW8250537.1 DUF4190 domain-containing protein [Myxococcales bacterium]
MRSPTEATRTSALAVASLVTGVLTCVPFLGLAAFLLGSAGLLRIRSSGGRLGGTAFAVVGLSLGAFNALVSLMLLLALGSDDPPPARPPAPPPIPSPTTPAVPPAGGDEGGQMTIINQVTEVMVGKVRLVDLPPTRRTLEAELEAQRAQALAAREKLVLFTGAEGCRPCMSVAAVLPEAKMQAALAGTRLVRVDVNVLGQELNDLGVPTKKIPGFYLLGKDFSPTDGINGGEWDDDTADNAGPVLENFLKGTLRKRREPFSPLPQRHRVPPRSSPRSGSTFL